MAYLGGVLDSMFSLIFIAFAIGAVGYLVGGISIKGVSLGTAGVLLVALIYGILVNYVPSFTIGGAEISLYDPAGFKVFSNIGTALFVTAVGYIAGPKFFRTMNKKSLAYILMGLIVISSGALVAVAIILIFKVDAGMVVGLLTGGLTSTPGLSAATEGVAEEVSNAATAGYGIAYIYGVLGVVLFVQLLPKILKVDIAKEREAFVAAGMIAVPEPKRKLIKLDSLDFFPFFLAVAVGVIIGSIKIPGINFSLGTSGGTLVSGLLFGHLAHIGPVDLRVSKNNLNVFRELGLVLFLIGAGVPGGVRFIENLQLEYFLYGVALTTIPMIVGYIFARYVFKLSIFNNLGSITGGMTSTPALGALISTAGTDEVASAYAATYPVALVAVVLVAKIIIML
ncbi:MAG: YidE/YbjL duplication [Ruminococcaceae bacterium]|nr:YidE/YbjL duplication [Oscillospiraceae bacterium]